MISPQRVEIAAQNGLIFLMDALGGHLPDSTWKKGDKVLSTQSCISIACMNDCNGPTALILGSFNQVGRVNSPIFDDSLETPNRIIVCQLVDCTEVARVATERIKSRVRIWTNRSIEPDEVVVSVD
jgi:hypothetical protein